MAVSTGRRRAHVVLPDALMREVDARVGQRKRREFIEEAIEEKLNRLRRVEAFDRVVGSLKDGGIPEWETSESTAEWLSALRQDRDLGGWYERPHAKPQGEDEWTP